MTDEAEAECREGKLGYCLTHPPCQLNAERRHRRTLKWLLYLAGWPMGIVLGYAVRGSFLQGMAGVSVVLLAVVVIVVAFATGWVLGEENAKSS